MNEKIKKKPTKKNDNERKILDFVQENFEVSTRDIVEFVAISPQATHKHLKKLVEQNKLKKMGNPPKVFYKMGNPQIFSVFSDFRQSFITELFTEKQQIQQLKTDKIKLKQKILTGEFILRSKNFIEDLPAQKNIKTIRNEEIIDEILSEFLVISPEGEILNGLEAFDFWCKKRGFSLEYKLKEYLQIQEKYEKFKTQNGEFIVATEKFEQTFGTNKQVDEVYYCDFYSVEIFGKTKLGNLLLHGKQSQNIKIILQVCTEVRDRIVEFINQNKIDAVAFIPPTTPRKPQFMDEFAKILNLKLPIIKLEKIVNDIAIQQKTLKSSQDRIENAQNTIFVDEKREFKNILLLDDAVGSGSTFNEIAHKIRKKKILKKNGKIFAIAIVGSANGIVDGSKKFEVINEV